MSSETPQLLLVHAHIYNVMPGISVFEFSDLFTTEIRRDAGQVAIFCAAGMTRLGVFLLTPGWES